ncbi:MAG TPA: acyltransferase [Rudaea sp.]|nr:acyltransferase [Rudaea sp.]
MKFLTEFDAPRRTLADCFDHGQDNFLLLRLIAAAMVMYGHSYGFCGMPNHGDIIARQGLGYGIYSGSIAVDMFFAISGFLVCGSYLNRANLEAFLKSRALRILPALITCVVLCAIVLGPLFTTLALPEYLRDLSTRMYVWLNLKLGSDMQWNLPGVFTHNFYPGAVNGSLWTLPAEIRMYAWIAILGALGILSRRRLANAVLLVLFVFGVVAPDHLPLVIHPSHIPLAGMFLIGTFCFVNRDKIPVGNLPMLGLLCITALAHKSFLFPYLFGLTVAYFCFWFAYVPNFHWFNRFGDYSYGLYLWGFPVQQAVSDSIGRPVHPWVNLAASLPIALALAIASWHLIEKPALRWKTRPNPVVQTVGKPIK